MNQTISASNAPAAVGPYSHAKLAGNTLYASGQIGLIPATGELAHGLEAQAVQAACGRRLLAGLAEEEQAVFLGLLERVLREMEELGAEKERWT